ncbi:MAG: hypothetical protein JJU36_02330 [Phycisphaeraceae bacterium]|nr:hypothetical protein [Phycisphaeraceae bacterium]
MSGSIDLLRMLEPPVRPDGRASHAAPIRPIETLSFDELLIEQRRPSGSSEGQAVGMEAQAAGNEAGDVKAAERPGTLGLLAALDRMDNPSVMRMRGGA